MASAHTTPENREAAAQRVAELKRQLAEAEAALRLLSGTEPATGSGETGPRLDFSDREKSEESLRLQSRVLESMTEGVNVVDEDGIILFSNPACDAMFGYAAGTLVGQHVSVLNDFPLTQAREVSTRLFDHVTRNGPWIGEIANRKKDGTPFVTRAHISSVDIGGRTCAVTVREDVTETKQLQSQLLRAQRMESIGRLAGGIAHDMNNILTPIMMAAPLLREGLDAGLSDKLLATVETSARRGSELVKQLLFFGRGVEGDRVALRVRDCIREIEQLVRETFPRSIALETDLPADAGSIRADPTQMHQVLLNLCVNGRDAMPKGGTLTIRVCPVLIDAAFQARNPDAQAGPHVCISVSDTGTGIAAEHLDRIFEPFFTTKEFGKGSGLGLSTAMGIVKTHGGFMRVQSELGHGTTFLAYLPALPVPAQPAVPAVGPAPQRGNQELLLIVDDEDSIRSLTKDILSRHGYRVIAAADGAEALDEFARHQADVSVVVTDYDMPTMDGLALIRALKSRRPDLRVVVSSGVQSDFDAAARSGELTALGVNAVLAKPYTAEKILTVVHQVIAR